MSFVVSTSEYVIAGVLDKIAAWAHITVPAAGQLITVFAIANAVGSPLFVMAAKLAVPGQQARAIGTVITGFSASLIIGVPVGRVVAEAYDWKAIFVGIGILSFLAIFTVF